MTFKVLTPEEKVAFQQYAATHNPENMQLWSVYHPVCRAVWQSRGIGCDMPACDDLFIFDKEETEL